MTTSAANHSDASVWLADAKAALAGVEALYEAALAKVRARVTKDGKLSAELIETDQHAAHGLAWFATYKQSLSELIHYAERLIEEGAYGETEQLLTRIGFAEFLAQVFGGIPMSQGEIVRLFDFGLSCDEVRAHSSEAGNRLTTRPPRRSAPPVSTRRSRRSAPRCANSPRTMSRPSRRSGTPRMNISRSR
jgi:(2S)-methylsuccinyl-CoA dehydrogenase